MLAIEREAVVQYRNRLEENVKWVQDYIEYETQTLVTYKAIIAVICDSLLLESIIPHDVVQGKFKPVLFELYLINLTIERYHDSSQR